ncbi:UNVERIFIED_CONTAM: hypothetical protein HDU68_002189, partial [Siphonaria sp. JEL0065]
MNRGSEIDLVAPNTSDRVFSLISVAAQQTVAESTHQLPASMAYSIDSSNDVIFIDSNTDPVSNGIGNSFSTVAKELGHSQESQVSAQEVDMTTVPDTNTNYTPLKIVLGNKSDSKALSEALYAKKPGTEISLDMDDSLFSRQEAIGIAKNAFDKGVLILGIDGPSFEVAKLIRFLGPFKKFVIAYLPDMDGTIDETDFLENIHYLPSDIGKTRSETFYKEVKNLIDYGQDGFSL